MENTYYDQLGGRDCIDRVHSILYAKLFAHSWLKGFFEGKDRTILESQQTEFMMLAFDGPKIFGGRIPRDAHVHIFITDEIFDIRHELLRQSLNEAKVPENLQERWLSTDEGMRRAVVKESPDQCRGRYKTDPVIIMPKPEGF